MIGFRRRFTPVLLALGAVLVAGTAGYMLIEGWSLLDSLYMTTITLTTIGFGEVRPLSPAGRVFTIFLIFFGLGIVLYSTTSLAEHLIAGDVAQQLRRRRMLRAVQGLSGHVIICGYGRVGRTAAQALGQTRLPLVVVDQSPAGVAEAREDGCYALLGDATQDEMLQQAGIAQASSMIVATGKDADNLFIVLSARSLNPKLYIVARASEAGSEPKLRRAGASRVVSPYQMGGEHMANLIIRPRVTEFLDVVTLDSGQELWLEELRIQPASPLAGQTVGQSDIRHRTGVNLIAVRQAAAGTIRLAGKDTVLAAGDELIALGTREQLAALAALAGH